MRKARVVMPSVVHPRPIAIVLPYGDEGFTNTLAWRKCRDLSRAARATLAVWPKRHIMALNFEGKEEGKAAGRGF